MTNKLYLVKLRGMQYSSSGPTYGISYVVAENSDEAYKKVLIHLAERNIGFSSDRELESVSLIAEETDYPLCKIKLYL